jgi:hypothetical protein
MTVRAMEDVKENGEYVYKQTEYKGITRINFK